jgi:dephospho-CoA kinase
LRIADCGLRIRKPPAVDAQSTIRNPQLLNIALTGNIAAGKTTVVELFRRWGATVIDADELARDAQAPGSATLAAIASRFGTDVLAPDGTLDRPALRAKVMGDDAALASLNAIVHPVVRRRRDELHAAALARGDLLLVNDIPLLFEALDPSDFEVVVLVDAPPAVRRTRLRTLRHLSNEDADRMIASQMPSERKRPRSHFVIDNDGSLAQLEPKTRTVFEALRARAAQAAWGANPSPVALVAEGPRDPEAPLLQALGAALTTAGVTAYRVAGKAPTIQKAMQNVPPAHVVTTAAAADAAITARRRLGQTSTVSFVRESATATAGRTFDLRPWGGVRVTLFDNPLP